MDASERSQFFGRNVTMYFSTGSVYPLLEYGFEGEDEGVRVRVKDKRRRSPSPSYPQHSLLFTLKVDYIELDHFLFHQL